MDPELVTEINEIVEQAFRDAERAIVQQELDAILRAQDAWQKLINIFQTFVDACDAAAGKINDANLDVE